MPPRPATKAATAPVSAVLGVDISARSTKAAVIDATTGRLLTVGRASHTVTGRYGARESAPETRSPSHRVGHRPGPQTARRTVGHGHLEPSDLRPPPRHPVSSEHALLTG
ncbi:hypothetical protein [Streptomyces sp. NBC_01589]|uniref:hypothetical protein n=1 Tax=unclassified Streptomyces TaxID=2593676 RepID=UPI00386C8302